MDLLRIATAGSVDDGKSTLIGRLLYDSKAIFVDQMQAIERASRQRGDATLDLALLTDGLRAEREQGITIDVAYRYFATPRRKFVIADTPGHIQYTRNMVTGASTAELAIVLIDARRGVLTQSRRHGYLASLLQIPHIVVAVNKMDLVGFDQAVYAAIVANYTAFAAGLALENLHFIPISALQGDNVVEESLRMRWYDGPSLLHYLETVEIGVGRNLTDFRFPVQLAVRPNQDFRGYAGQVASGSIAAGDEVAILPSGLTSRVCSILASGEPAPAASLGDSVVITLEHELDISRGDMIVRKGQLPVVTDRLECTLCWLSEEVLVPSREYLLQHTTHQMRARILCIHHRVDVDTLTHEEAATLTLNEIGQVQIQTARLLFYDPYTANRATGSFILIDPYSHNTVAAGMILASTPPVAAAPARQTSTTANRPRSTNVTWEGETLSRQTREVHNGHLAAVLWLTGLSGAGKSTVARLVEQRLFDLGCQTFYLDGDNVRHGLNGDLGFSAADRKENIRRVAEVARLAFMHGQLAICAFISPFQADRDLARLLIPQGRFLEIYVRCSAEECARRDPKGLYARARRGEIAEFTGISSPYEPPLAPEMVLDTERTAPEEAVSQVLEELVRRRIVKLPMG